jgi:hypothetical protein
MLDIEQIEIIHQLSKKGMNQSQIARKLHIDRRTVKKYLTENVPQVPEQKIEDNLIKQIKQQNQVINQLKQQIEKLTNQTTNQNPQKIIIEQSQPQKPIEQKPVEQTEKKPSWREYIKQSHAPEGKSHDENYLNKLVEHGFSVEHIKKVAKEKELI